MTTSYIWPWATSFSNLVGTSPPDFKSGGSKCPPSPPPPVATPMVRNMSRKLVVICKDAPREYYHMSQKRVVLCKTRFVRQHQRKSLFTPTSAKISTNQWYYFLSFIGRIAQTHRMQNSSNTNFSHLAFFFCSQSWLRPVGLGGYMALALVDRPMRCKAIYRHALMVFWTGGINYIS